VAWDLLGVQRRAMLCGGCAVAVGVGAVLELCCSVETVVGPDVATKRAGLLGEGEIVGRGGQEKQREQKLMLRLPCGAVGVVRGCCYRRDFRQSARAAVNSQRGGGKDYNGGIKRKRQKMGRLIQNCATTAEVKLAR
jgi:hypothetical protein